jgi:hypothetical protein
MPRRGKSECVAEGLSQQVGVKIARHGRTDKRTSTVLVVILLVLSASLCPDIDAQVRPGLRVGIGLLQNVDGSAQGRGVLGRLEAVTAFLAWRRADKHAVEKKGRTRKSSPETCTSEYE